MAAIAFAIVQHETPLLEVTAKRDEADFGRVRLPCEHGLGKERFADGDPVQSSDEVARPVPNLDGVRESSGVERLVAFYDVGPDPGHVHPSGARLGASHNDIGESSVEHYLVLLDAQQPPRGLRDMDAPRKETIRSAGAHHFCGPI